MNYSFPAVFGSVSWVPWNTRPDLSGKNAGQYFPQTQMMRDSYSGPCTAVVEEAFSPDGTWPKGWGLGRRYSSRRTVDISLHRFAITVCPHASTARWL